MCAGVRGREVCVAVGLRVNVVWAVRLERGGARGGDEVAQAGLGGAGDDDVDAKGVLARDFRGVVRLGSTRVQVDG